MTMSPTAASRIERFSGTAAVVCAVCSARSEVPLADDDPPPVIARVVGTPIASAMTPNATARRRRIWRRRAAERRRACAPRVVD
jgi:hypothetical protein